MVRQLSGVHLPSLALSWASTMMMLGWGIVLAIPGGSLIATFHYLEVGRYLTEDQVGFSLIIVACLRGAALLVNGRALLSTASTRAIVAASGVILWVQFLYGFVSLAIGSGVIGVAIPTCVVLAGADFYSCMRAVMTVAREYRARRDVAY